MAEKRLTAEQFVRNVLVNSFGQSVDNDTLQKVAEKVQEAVSTRQKPSRDKEAA